MAKTTKAVDSEAYELTEDGEWMPSDTIAEDQIPPWMLDSLDETEYMGDEQVQEEMQVAEEQSKGGWFANSWLGRQFGLDDKSQEEKRAKEAAEANAGQESGGFWNWMRNSMVGRLIGVDDKSRAEKQAAEANAGQESGGFWNWMRNSMVGRLIGVDDKSRAEKQAAEVANAGQESGGLWSWMRNSWLGRQFGLDDMSRIQKSAPMEDSVDIETPTAMAQAPVREQPTVSRPRAQEQSNNRPRSVAKSDSVEKPKLKERKVTSDGLVKKKPLTLDPERLAATNLGESAEKGDAVTLRLDALVNAPRTPLNVGGLPEQTDNIINQPPLVLTMGGAAPVNAPRTPLEVGLTGVENSNYNKLLRSNTEGTNQGSLLNVFNNNALNITGSGTISVGGLEEQEDITQITLNPNLMNMGNNR